MVRRSTPQRIIDDRAFPIRVQIAVPARGVGPDFHDYMRDEIGTLNWASHGGASKRGNTMCVYLRRTADLLQFLDRFPHLELYDGVEDEGYDSPALAAVKARKAQATNPDYVTLGQLDANEDDGMCNRYRLKDMPAEVAGLFGASLPADTNAGPGDVHPGSVGMVIAEGQLRSMSWGFPFRPVSKITGEKLALKPVNNVRDDKLRNYMWRDSFDGRRCLIPVSAFAEAEGAKGQMTRTWMSLPDQATFAVAGIWRDSEEWGPVYSMIMTQSAGEMRTVHDRMPVILRPEDWARWTGTRPADAYKLIQAYTGTLTIDRTDESWVQKKAKI